ncbi:MAG: T9SS type A sorting domain-containing protein, partial [Candidatus Eisenbacteria bacterium]|nr:T9SS type A sorting domain-containing protein [Candidatus Eisenbacteria bacterium]
LVSDESADPNDLGGGLGAVFRLGRNQEPASILEAGPPFVDPSSILFRSDGHLIIADRQAANPGEVFELDPNRGTLESMLTDNSALPTPVDLVETPDGDLLIVDRSADFNGNTAGEGGLFLLERGATVPTLLSGDPEFRFLSEATYLADGRLFVTDRSANPGQVSSASIFEINPSTGAIENTWQFPQLVEPTGLTTYQDTLLLITDLVANPRNFSTTTGTLFTLDPDEGTLSEFLAIARLVRPYRSYPQQDGSVLILDQAASPNGLPDQTGIIFRYDPAARVLRDFAWTDGLVFPSEVAQLPASAIQFSAYGVEDTDGAPLRASDRVAIQAEIRNDGSIPAVAEFEDTLPDGVVAVPGSVEATVGTAVIVGNTITWTGELSPAQSAQISYEAQLDPPRVKDRILEFAPLARGPIVGELSRTAHLAVFVGFDPGYFYVVDEDADPLLTGRGRGAILKVQQRTGTTVSLFADLDWVVPIDLAILGDSNPKLYLLDVAQQPPNGRRGAVFEVDPSDLSSRLAAADVSWLRTESIVPFEEDGLLVVDSWADPFLLDDPVGPGAVYYVEPTSGQVLPLVSDTTWVRPIDIAQTKTGRWLLLDADADPLGTGVNRGAIWELDLAEGTSTLFAASPEWVEPVAITVAGDSTIYVVDQRATPSGNGIGSIWTVPDTPGSTPVLYAVSDEFRRPHDLVVQIDGDLVLVDGEAAPAAQETGRGAIFVSQGQGFAPLAAVELMREPRSILVFGDVTPIVDLHLYARPLDLGVEVGWTGLAGASGVDYLIYRRVVEGPDVDLSGEPDLEDYELVPTEVTFRGTGEHVFVDRTVEPDTWYAYVIASVRNSGGYDTSYPVTARSGSLAFALGNGEPNPFGGQTTLRFQIPRTGQVDLEIFDVGGRRVRRLVSEPLEAGRHQVVWDGRSDRSHPLASGVYFVRLAWDGKVLTNRMVRLK